MSDIEGIVRAGVKKRVATLSEIDRRWRDLQADKLRAIVLRNADTEFGRAHGFDRIDSPAAYRSRVPLSGPGDYHDAWKRIEAGERGVLFADPVYAFALSSGTTGAPKKVPLTKALVRGLKRATGYTTAAYMARTGNFSLLRGYALQIAAPMRLSETAQGVPIGYVTGIIGGSHTYPFHNIAIPPPEVLNIEDWVEKCGIIAERYAHYDVRMAFGVTSYVMGFFRYLLERRGDCDLAKLWPKMELVVTSGIPLGHYRAFAEKACPNAEFLELYLATEAAMACQVEASPAGMMPMVEDIYYEFVPEAEWGRPDARRIPLAEVETDVPYVMAITTPSGLYAYSPGDVVRFLGNDPPRLQVQGRQGTVLNLATEKLDAEQAARIVERTGFDLETFTVCPAADGACAHEWVIEFRGEPPLGASAAKRIDALLIEANPLYAHMREGDLLMKPPSVTAVREGTFYAALQRRPGQGKILPIYLDRTVRDELVALSRG